MFSSGLRYCRLELRMAGNRSRLVATQAHRSVVSEKVEHVGVDYARMLIADFDVLGAWHHGDSLDGLADFVFWGGDAEQVALDARSGCQLLSLDGPIFQGNPPKSVPW